MRHLLQALNAVEQECSRGLMFHSRLRWFVLALVLPALLARGAEPTQSPPVVLVLDASASMWSPLEDGTLRMAAARLTVLDLLDALGTSDTPLSVRTFGGADDGRDAADPCAVTRALPAGDVRLVLGDLRPGGVAPLIGALSGAVNDVGDHAAGGGIILVTSTSDQCHADADRLLDRLRAAKPPVTVRVVGLALPAQEAESFSAVTPTRNVTTTAELAEALRWAASEVGLEIGRDAPARLELALGDGPPFPGMMSARVVHVATGAETVLKQQGDEQVGALSPGAHLLKLHSADDAPPVATLLIRALAGRATRIELPLQLPDEPRISWGEHPPQAGGSAIIQLAGASDLRPGWLTAEPVSSPVGAWATRAAVASDDVQAEIPLVDRPLTVEARLWRDLQDGVSLLVARASADLAQAEVALIVPDRLETNRPVVLEWSGPAVAGDRVTMARPQDASVDHELCVSATGDGAAAAVAPGRAGGYEVRYVSGRSLRVLQRVPVELFEVPARLWSPVQATAGRSLEVHWDGPDAPTDFLTIVPADAPPGAYTSFATTAGGTPATLEIPRSPGEYEVRYVAGRSSATLATRPLLVVAMPATVTGPERAPAGGRLEVRWEGPDATEDVIAVARPDWPPQRSLDWTFTAMGSPLSLAAPDKPGRYELRYVSGEDQQILARTMVEVQ